MDVSMSAGIETRETRPRRHGTAPPRMRGLTRADKLVGAVLGAFVLCSAVFLGFALVGTDGETTTQNEAPREYEFPTENATSTISVDVGKVFIVQLNSNAGSTGFDWKVTTTGGIHYINYTAVQEAPMMLGAEVRHYYFRAVAAGNETITLQNLRSWDPSQIPATIVLTVTAA